MFLKSWMHIVVCLTVAMGVQAAKAEEIKPEPLHPGISDSAGYTAYFPPKEKSTGQAVIILPGGGFKRVGRTNGTGSRWFNDRGIAAFTLYYRLPNGNPEVPMSDIREMLKLVRKNAKKWKIDPKNVGIIGYSSGGQLAVLSATVIEDENKPDFMIAFYPAVSFVSNRLGSKVEGRLIGENASPEKRRQYSAELNVTAKTPRTLLFASYDDDVVPTEESLLFYKALIKARIPSELHVYDTGGHRWDPFMDFTYKDDVLSTMERWLKGPEKAKEGKKR